MINWTYGFYIHTPYQHQADHVCEILHALGYKWANGESLLDDTYWSANMDEMHYHVRPNTMQITYARYPTAGIDIFSYSEFVEDCIGAEEPLSISEFL